MWLHLPSIVHSFYSLSFLFSLFFFFFLCLLLPFQVVFDWAEQGDQQQSEGKKKEREKRKRGCLTTWWPRYVGPILFHSFLLSLFYLLSLLLSFWTMAATWGFRT